MSLLHRRPEERVRIVVPRVAAVDALVVRVVTGAAEFLIAADPGVPVRFLHRRRAVVMPLDGDDRIDGTLLAVPGRNGRVRDDLLHFLEDVIPLAPPRPRRREFARVPVVRPVAMVPTGFRVGWLNGFTRDLSAGGLLVTGAQALELGDRLRLRVDLDGEEDLLDTPARVVRADDDWGLRALRLEGLDERARERLVRFVHERQRRALAELRARAG
jgi:PilZ domain-containing protein